MDKFVNLHVHSDCSIGDSVIKIPNLIKLVQQYKQEYVALTDHSTVMGHYSLQQACKGTSVKPILGNEFYCKTSLGKPTDKTRFHLVLLAQNEQGLQNIRMLQRLSVKEHFYYKPLLPHDLLFNLDLDGIFISTACALSYINQNFLEGNDEEANNFFNKLLDKYGNKNVSIELQYHPTWTDEYGRHTQNFLNEKLIELYDNTDCKYIINTFDSHFLKDEDRILRKKIQSIAWKKPEDEINDSLKSNCLGTSAFSYELAYESGIDDDNLIQKCIDNTHKIAEKCYFQPKSYDRVIPKFDKHKEFKEIFLKKVV